MTQQVIQTTLVEQVAFVDYCEMFYGEGQMYAIRDFATRDQIWGAMQIYHTRGDEQFFIEGEHRWGGGDTIDREIVAGILMNEFNVDLY